MRNAYRKRPNDFRRRILETDITDRQVLLERESYWLSFISHRELGKRYYNLHNHKKNHWTANPLHQATVSEKISKAWTPQRRAAMSELKRMSNPMHNSNAVSKVADKNRGRKAWNKGTTRTELQRAHQSMVMSGRQSPTKGIPNDRVAHSYLVTTPLGDQILVNNLNTFCKENQLWVTHMRLVASGRKRQYKGFKCQKAE